MLDVRVRVPFVRLRKCVLRRGVSLDMRREGFKVAAKGCHSTWKREMPRQTADFPTVSEAAAGRLEIKQVFRPSDDGYKEGGSSAIFFSVTHARVHGQSVRHPSWSLFFP